MLQLKRRDLIQEAELVPYGNLLAAGRMIARDWQVGPCAFLEYTDHTSEASYKRAQMAAGNLMQHAHVGFREISKSVEACKEIYERCNRHGAVVDRYGLCLDWSMGYPADVRKNRPRGTGMILNGPEDFVKITSAAPVAPHFGDFVLGLPNAVENTKAALAAGSTSLGNLGQYFTFRLPHWDDDVATTEATITALGLIVAQDVEVLIHSNLDDGFAAMFMDLSSCLGMVLIEKWIIEDLIGGQVSHCFGHHFADPVIRNAFQSALNRVSTTPGTMIFGSTVSYRSTPAGNYASLASYMLADIIGQRRHPSGHALNPVPVTENERIPDIDEIIDAQIFAHRLVEHATYYEPMLGWDKVDQIADTIVEGGRRFRDNVLKGLHNAGIDTNDAMELMLAIRRLGPKRMEKLFGVGLLDTDNNNGRIPQVPTTTIVDLNDMSMAVIENADITIVDEISRAGLKCIIATTDVHEHGKYLVERVLSHLGVDIIDGGVAVDPDDLVRTAKLNDIDFIALSTYNGIALRYIEELKGEMKRASLNLPVLVGGKLNQIPADTNSSLPIDVTSEIRALDVVVCDEIEMMIPALHMLARET